MKIWQTTDGEVKDGKYLVVRRDGTVPEWPNFVIGGYDPAAAAAMRAYGTAAGDLGYEREYVWSCFELAKRFEELSATSRAIATADPTAPPHRKDLPEVIAMMRREFDVAALVARITALEAELNAKVEALTLAELTFRHYGGLHAAKPDMEKASRNYELADKMKAALATGETHALAERCQKAAF